MGSTQLGKEAAVTMGLPKDLPDAPETPSAKHHPHTRLHLEPHLWKEDPEARTGLKRQRNSRVKMGLWELGEATMSASKLNPALKPSNSYIRSSPSSLLYVMPKANLASKMSLAVFLSYISFAILYFSFSFFSLPKPISFWDLGLLYNPPFKLRTYILET